MNRRRVSVRAWVVAALWLAAAVLSGALVIIRYRAAVVGQPFDFYEYFHPAGKLILQGRSPFDEPGYVYSPIVAVLAALVDGMADPVIGWTVLSLCAGVLAVALFTWTVWPTLKDWHRPLVATAAIVTLYYNWQTVIMMFLGQTETYVLLAMVLAGLASSHQRPGLVGSALGLAALIKTWPIVSGLWLARRGAERRWTSILWALATITLGVGATALAFGQTATAQWIANVLAARTQSRLVHFSAWDVGRQLFDEAAGGLPLWVSPGWAMAVTVFAVASAAGLLAVTLWWPGDDLLSMWHVFVLAIILLPVSHSFYLLQALPILWLHTYRVANDPRNVGRVLILGVWVIWWVVTARIQWPGDMVRSVDTVGYAVMMAATLVALATSVVAEAQNGRCEQHRAASGPPEMSARVVP